MRIAYLCKRQYMSHDVIEDRYARLYEQPYQLALRGHNVLGVCLSYRQVDAREEVHEADPGSLRWAGLSNGKLGILGMLFNIFQALRMLRAFKPDIIIGASDAIHVVLGNWMARWLGVPFAADLYDHFESFGLSRLPGLIPLYRRALRHAAVVTCVSEPLAELVKMGYRARGIVLALPSTINQNLFYPRDSHLARQHFGLPLSGRLIGTAGGLSKEKGIEPVYRAFEELARIDPHLHLVLAGPLDPKCPPPQTSRVHYLGMLPHAQVAELFGMLDVAIVYIRDTPYGQYSFPQKAYEIAACGVPMVAARVGAMIGLLEGCVQALYQPDDAISLINALKAQLAAPVLPTFPIPDWADMAAELERVYAAAVSDVGSVQRFARNSD